MRIGYARISTAEQKLDLQKDALTKAGCEKIIEDTASGSKQHRSGLDQARELLERVMNSSRTEGRTCEASGS